MMAPTTSWARARGRPTSNMIAPAMATTTWVTMRRSNAASPVTVPAAISIRKNASAIHVGTVTMVVSMFPADLGDRLNEFATGGATLVETGA